ncbi:MAG: di-trans,poly-cis-decaprenylcistransferase [Holosporales bacterium]|jgi:undecaprenyl diphosphate synthase|nr:di-trans,poly-cis-decaprenylcistransferase [Holosporales bacterium]
MNLTHIAFIVDGNSTWAKEREVPQLEGYRAGMRAVASTVIAAHEFHIKYVTFYIFSSENWHRPASWILDFMNLARCFFDEGEQIKWMLEIGARLMVIGDKTKLGPEFLNILNKLEEKTKDNNGIFVQLAISYGSRDEIVRAARRMLDLGINFTETNISNNLDTAGIPDPQLIVRTGRKQRLSNFLMWQASYSELYFPPILWPDFDKVQLQIAIDEFYTRERTYGR